MFDPPLVSIVTPSYNTGKFIQETIDSIRSQNYPHLEHIVVDGGSTDDTIDILRHSHDIDWVSEPDHGQSHALNKGFAKTNGSIIGWLNADDTYNANTLKTVVDYFGEFCDVDVVYSDCRIIDEEGRPTRLAVSRPFDLETLIVENYIHQPTVFFRRHVIDGIGPINESLHLVMDWEFWVRAGLKYSFHYLPTHILANFRYCTGTKTAEMGQEAQLEWINALEESIRFLPDFPKQDNLYRLALRKAWGRYYMVGVYEARQSGQWHHVRRDLVRAIMQDPSWVRNRGTWSIAKNAILYGIKGGS